MAVLLGGDSSEREISLLSGNAVLAALGRRGVDGHGIRPARAVVAGSARAALRSRVDRVARPGWRGRDRAGRARVSRAFPTPAAACWARRSGWTSCAPSAWRRRSEFPSPDSWSCAARRTSSWRSSGCSCRSSSSPPPRARASGMTKVERAEELPAAYRDGGSGGRQRLRGVVDQRRGVHGGAAAGRGAALDPHRDAARLLRLRGEVLPRRHALSLSRRVCRSRPSGTCGASRSRRSPPPAGRAGGGRIS